MFDELVEIICNYVDVQPADVHEESRFMEDLGFTSFDFMSMLGEIEDTFDVEIEQTKAAEIRTVQEAIDYLETLKDMDQIADAFKEARNTKGMPTAIIAHTVKGKGVSFMENQVGWHGKAPNDEEYAVAMEDLRKEGEALCQK